MIDNKIKSAMDAAGTAADYSARATYQRGYDAGVASVASERDETMRGLDAAIARAETAETSLAEWHGVEAVGPIAGRWCLASERDAAIARADAAEARAEVAIARACEAVEAREWALGVQVVAQAARLKLADDVVSAARALISRTVGLGPCLADYVAMHKALAAYDAVPGDDDKETT